MTDVYEYAQVNHDSTLLIPADIAASDRFGTACAVDGDVMVIGTRYQNSGAGASAGAVYVYENIAGTWTQVDKLAGAAAGVLFGYSVAVSNGTIVIGASKETVTTYLEGTVHVYTKVGGTWTLQQRLVAPTPHDTGGFGQAVAIDGDIVVAGGSGGLSGNSGWAWAFHRVGTTWGAGLALAGTGQSANDGYGSSVAISGTTAVVGSPSDETSGTNRGSAYVFDYFGGAWSETIRITGTQDSGYLGSAVAIDGTLLAIGSYGDSSATFSAGSVHVYELDSGTWTFRQECYVTNIQRTSDYTAQHHGSVAVVGNAVVVGVLGNDLFSASSGLLLGFLPTTNWTTGYSHWMATPGAAANQYFGQCIGYDGTTLVVGAPMYAASDTGAAYVFEPEKLVAGTDVTPPSVSVSPAAGTPIAPTDTVTITVTDSGTLRRIVLLAKYAQYQPEVIWDGYAFQRPFLSSVQTPVGGGVQLEVARTGGWKAGPTIQVIAIDSAGNEA